MYLVPFVPSLLRWDGFFTVFLQTAMLTVSEYLCHKWQPGIFLVTMLEIILSSRITSLTWSVQNVSSWEFACWSKPPIPWKQTYHAVFSFFIALRWVFYCISTNRHVNRFRICVSQMTTGHLSLVGYQRGNQKLWIEGNKIRLPKERRQ
jgi:hypothetical protein